MNQLIGVVIVTFNRSECLKKALDCYDAQSLHPKYVIVINNASTDNTSDILYRWKKDDKSYSKYVVELEKNIGGSGGFYTGLEIAMGLDADWVWLADDDAYPDYNAIKNANDFLIRYKNHLNEISALAAQVMDKGKTVYRHRRTIKQKGIKVVNIFSKADDYKKEYFNINCFSYVGAIINRNKLVTAGLPQKDYFIWYDDSEHSLRLSEYGNIYCVPAIKVEHHDSAVDNNGYNWKDYYGIRNFADMIRLHFPWYCYCYYIFKWLILSFYYMLIKKEKKKSHLIQHAIFDALHHRLGINEKYTPN